MMRRCSIAFLFVALPIAAVLTHAQTTTTSQPASSSSMSGLELQFMDRGVDPCTDFYEFACGGWTKNQPIPADRSAWGRAQELQERNNTTLRRILEDAGRNTSADVDTRKIGDYYASCMDESAINAKGAAPLAPALSKIAALTGLPIVTVDFPGDGVYYHTSNERIRNTLGFEAEWTMDRMLDEAAAARLERRAKEQRR